MEHTRHKGEVQAIHVPLLHGTVPRHQLLYRDGASAGFLQLHSHPALLPPLFLDLSALLAPARNAGKNGAW